MPSGLLGLRHTKMPKFLPAGNSPSCGSNRRANQQLQFNNYRSPEKAQGGLHVFRALTSALDMSYADDHDLASFSKWENQSLQRFKNRLLSHKRWHWDVNSWRLLHHPTHRSTPLLSMNEGAFPALSGPGEAGKPQRPCQRACEDRMCVHPHKRRA